MNNRYLIQIATSPIDPNDLEVNDWKLDKFFFEQNPWGLGRIVDVDRKEALDELKDLLPNDCILDPNAETIDLSNNHNYLAEAIDHLKNNRPNLLSDIINLYGWWHNRVCLFGDILIYFENGELFTLTEFLFYAMDERLQMVYIGTVYKYDY